LSFVQEEELAKWILQLKATGNAPSHHAIRQMASYVSSKNGQIPRIGKRWLERFWKRHPNVHSKRAIRMDHERVNGANKQDLSAWYTMFRGILNRLNVDLKNLWSMDETGTQLGAQCHHKVAGSSKNTKAIKKIPKGRE
jgi:Tc5 transposase DNA-binding domain